MWTLRNLKLLTLSTVVPLKVIGDMSYSLLLPVVHNQLLGFAEVKMEAVVLAPRCQGSDLLSVRRRHDVADQAVHGCVISKPDDGVGDVCGHAVMGE